jgi:hypothetical protein
VANTPAPVSAVIRIAEHAGERVKGIARAVIRHAGLRREPLRLRVALAEGRPLSEALATVAGSGPADVSPVVLVQVQRALGG